MRRTTRVIICIAAAAAFLSGCAATNERIADVIICVRGSIHDCFDAPVRVEIDLPEELTGVSMDEIAVKLHKEGKEELTAAGQLVKRSANRAELWWILPSAEKEGWSNWTAVLSQRSDEEQAPEGFLWKDNIKGRTELLSNGRRLLRYMNRCDPSTPESLLESYKPYHHIFDENGDKFLTKGSGGLYTHHRGLFIGWNRLTFGGKEYDFWHMKGVVQKHAKLLGEAAGPVVARSRMLILWNLEKETPVIEETREITAFRQAGSGHLLLDFNTNLKAVKGDVFLNGDPEHAGFQFRAHNDIADGEAEVKATYLFHEDGVDPHENKDLPWAAMTIVLNGKRYTVQHMNHPDNPKDTLYSAYRDYGRFGAFFKKKIKHGESLNLRYRIHIEEGIKPVRAEMEKRYKAFACTPEAKVWSVSMHDE